MHGPRRPVMKCSAAIGSRNLCCCCAFWAWALGSQKPTTVRPLGKVSGLTSSGEDWRGGGADPPSCVPGAPPVPAPEEATPSPDVGVAGWYLKQPHGFESDVTYFQGVETPSALSNTRGVKLLSTCSALPRHAIPGGGGPRGSSSRRSFRVAARASARRARGATTTAGTRTHQGGRNNRRHANRQAGLVGPLAHRQRGVKEGGRRAIGRHDWTRSAIT